MARSSYREQDYTFGQIMLTLRTNIGLTQEGLAEFLGISRRTVGAWEAGSKYPNSQHLKHLIALAIQQRAFPVGEEADRVRSLWHAAHQKVLLDERWLADLLTFSTNELPPKSPLQRHNHRVDWGGALTIPHFYGREWEQAQLVEWILEERCRVVGVLGLGGIGKSALAVRLMHQIAGQFDVVIWRSLRDSPTCKPLIDDFLRGIALQFTEFSTLDFEQSLSLLLQCMREQRVLIVLDNFESLLEEGETSGILRQGYENYGALLRRISETDHQSCLLFTSREKPTMLVDLEIQLLRLTRLESKPCEQLLAEKGVVGSDAEMARLIDVYAGNPLALKIVAQTIVDLFDGEIAPFFDQGEVIFGNIRSLLAEQFARLSVVEQTLLFWLAILREPATLNELSAVLLTPTPRGRILEALQTLYHRSLIERGQAKGSFTLQSVVLEYLTARLVEETFDEIQSVGLSQLNKYGLELAFVREYVRQTQERVILLPLLDRLRGIYPQNSVIEERLMTLLAHLRGLDEIAQGYAPANLIVLLRLLRGDLRNLDLSDLALRSIYLQDVEMQDTHLVNATILNCSFTESFDAMPGVAISRTGEYWAGSSRRGELRIWAAGGRVLRHTWRGHTDQAWTLAFSPNEQILASGSNDGTLKLWDTASGKLLWSGMHTSLLSGLAFTPNGLVLASAGNDAVVHLWDVVTGKLLHSLPHPHAVLAIAWSPDGNLLASGDIKGCVRLWPMDQTRSTTCILELTEHTNCVNGLAISPDGRFLASASWDGTVKVWEIPNGRLLHTLTGHTDILTCVTWSSDGHTVASSSDDQTIILWDVENGRYRAALRGHTSHVYALAFTPDSLRLLSGSRDGTLRVWDVASERCVRVISGYAASVYDVDWSPDGNQLVVGGGNLVTIWDAMKKTPVRVLQEHIGILCAVGWSMNGRWLASSDSKHAIRLWDLKSSTDFKFVRLPDSGGNLMYGFAWSPDGQHLASGSHLGGVMIWNAATSHQEWIGRQLEVRFPRVAWSSDGTRLAGGGDDGIVYIWNVTQGSLELQLIGHHSRIRSLAWSPDGTRLASGTSGPEEGELFVWDTQNGNCLYSLTGHRGIISAVAWDASGKHLISGDGYGQLHWWDVQRGERLRVRDAHDGTVHSLRRSPDGSQLASCGDDGAITIWDLQSGEHLQTLRRDRPYERMNIQGIRGLNEAQKTTLLALGALEVLETPY